MYTLLVLNRITYFQVFFIHKKFNCFLYSWNRNFLTNIAFVVRNKNIYVHANFLFALLRGYNNLKFFHYKILLFFDLKLKNLKPNRRTTNSVISENITKNDNKKASIARCFYTPFDKRYIVCIFMYCQFIVKAEIRFCTIN